MKEKILNHKKNGFAMLFLIILLYAAGIGCVILGANMSDNGGGALAVLLLVVGCIWIAIGWVPLMGLKVLKPQEALVLTLFGNYIGTLKEEGFYYVNPFCSSVNPAAKTRLNQSGDVDGGAGKPLMLSYGQASISGDGANRKI